MIDRGALFGEASGANAGGLAIQTTAPAITADVAAAVEAWSRLADDLGEDVGFVRTGGLRVATSEAEAADLQATLPRLRGLGLTMEWLDGTVVRRDMPWLGPAVIGASCCAEEGFAVPSLTAAATRRALQKAGAQVFEHTAVTGLQLEGGRVRVQTPAGPIVAERLLIASGAWIGRVAAMLGLALPVDFKTFMVTTTAPAPLTMRQLVTHAQRNLTIKQFADGSCMIGGGWPGKGAIEPVRKEVDPDVLERNLRHAHDVVPGLSGVPIARAWAGLEGVTQDELPLMGPMPGHPRIFVIGCVRGGFVLGPKLAPLVANVVLGRAKVPPAYAPERFSKH